MLNNIKLGVTLSGIKVAEGGCVVAGKAELSGVSASILTDKQRVTLEKAYTAYNQILDVAYQNAGAIAEKINDFRDGVDKIKAWAKGYKGGNVDAAKAKAYQAFSQQAGKAMLESKAVPDNLKAKLKAASLAAAPAWEFFKTGKPCTASANSGGGNAFFKLPLADCRQYATLIETEMQAMETAQKYITLDINSLKKKYQSGEKITFQCLETGSNGSSNNLKISNATFNYDWNVELCQEDKKVTFDPNKIIMEGTNLKIISDQDPSIVLTYSFPSNTTSSEMQEILDWVIGKENNMLTGAKLKLIFPGTSQARCNEVAALINKYKDKFEINTPLRMAHFIGQIGIESNNLNAMGEKSGEDPCYTKKNNAWDFNSGKGEGWIAKKKWSETPINEGCDDFKKNLKGERKHPNWNSVNDVPKKYVCTNENPAAISGKNLFNYVYRCEGGNGDEASGDGFRYRGHGVMQLTWKKQYVAFNDWLKTNGFVDDYKKVLSDPDEGFKDKEIDILSAMWYWDKEKINDVADKVKKESNLESFKKVTLKINKQALANKERNDIFKTALNILK